MRDARAAIPPSHGGGGAAQREALRAELERIDDELARYADPIANV